MRPAAPGRQAPAAGVLRVIRHTGTARDDFGVAVLRPGARLRIWDIDTARLCRLHLLGEHRELHGLWNILTLHKRGYSHHPETLRWVGKLAALHARHEALVAEMARRGYVHASPLDAALATGCAHQAVLIDSVAEQERILRGRDCACLLRRSRIRPPHGVRIMRP